MFENRNIYVRAFAQLQESYDVFLGSLGFESRSSHVARALEGRARVARAFGFESRRVLSYEKNRDFLSTIGVVLAEGKDDEFEAWVGDALAAAGEGDPTCLSICVDLSSATRHRIALLLQCLARHAPAIAVEVDFVYAIAEFSPPAGEQSPIVQCGPVTPDLAGWWDDPELPTTAIIGLGYEQDRAMGAQEFVEASAVWAFLPTGEDDRYDRAMQNANRLFLDAQPEHRQVWYRVDDPFDTFVAVEGLAFSLVRESRLVLFPFGPKIFGLICMVVGMVHSPRAAVWRVSSGQLEEPVDRRATGKIVGLRVRFDPRRRFP